MRIAALSILALLAHLASASIQVNSAQVTDAAGNAITPNLGEPFYVTVGYSVSNQSSSYSFTFDAPSGKLSTGPLSFGVHQPGTYWVRWGTMSALYDGAEKINISSSASTATYGLNVTPQTPSADIETYAPQALTGTYGMSVQFNLPASKLVVWTPLPANSAWQSVTNLTGAPAIVGQASGTDQLIGTQTLANESTASTDIAVTLTASSVRVSAKGLGSVPMSDLAGVAPANATWLKSEPEIESGDNRIKSFARAASRGLNSKSSVYDVAKSVYSSLLKRSSYSTTGKAPDALSAFVNAKGECGDLSALFVASCRSLGIPARPVSGFCMGDNQWHVWAEFLVPGKGWVPVDPAYALGVQAHNLYPLFFGVVPAMRDRVADCVGFQQSLGGLTSSFLQQPEVFWFQGGLTGSAQVYCHLSAAPGA